MEQSAPKQPSVMKKKMKKTKPIFILLAATMLSSYWASAFAESLISFPETTTADIAIFRSDDPVQYSHHTLTLIPALVNNQNAAIPDSNQVTFRYDGTRATTVCDNTERNLGSAATPEIQNRISCTVDRSNADVPASQVYVSLTIFDPRVYSSSYADRPDSLIDPLLKGTSSGSPFCVSDDLIAPASFCKWEKQNLNDPVLMSKGVPLNAWVVYGRTSVTNLPLSYVIPNDQQYPFNDGDQVCAADLNSDGLVSTNEMTKCLETPDGFLCPFKKRTCAGTCPLGAAYPCLTHDGISECSPYTCREFTESTSVTSGDTTQGATDKLDDGTIDKTGKCLGQIYIFSGKDKRCRPDGIETGYFDCCGGSDIWFDVAGQPINPFLPPIGSIIASKIFNCKGDEKELIALNQKGLCHYVGSYCSLKIFGLCIQRKKTYCCFNSKLGRILQEQGRPTLRAFSSSRWGSAKRPNCRGFTPEEFQMLDFSKIDLSAWYGDIQVNTQQQITSTMQNKIKNAYDNIP